MRFYKFSERLPILGSNILVISEDGKKVAIVEFNLEIRKCILSECLSDYYGVDWFSDDPAEDGEYDIVCASYWCYPSSLTVPKKVKK